MFDRACQLELLVSFAETLRRLFCVLVSLPRRFVPLSVHSLNRQVLFNTPSARSMPAVPMLDIHANGRHDALVDPMKRWVPYSWGCWNACAGLKLPYPFRNSPSVPVSL